MKHRKDQFALVLSVIFHPVFIPSLMTLLFLVGDYIPLFNLDSSSSSFYNNILLVGTIILFASVLPIAMILILSKLKIITSIQAENREERPLPFFLTAVSAITGFYLMNRYFAVNPIFILFYFGYLLSLFFALVINSFTKISIHMMGIGGVIGTFVLLSILKEQSYRVEITVSILIAGFIAYSRLILKAHNQKQLLYGVLVGILSETIFLLWI